MSAARRSSRGPLPPLATALILTLAVWGLPAAGRAQEPASAQAEEPPPAAVTGESAAAEGDSAEGEPAQTESAPAEAAAEEPAPDPDRSSFQLPLAEEDGGGFVTGSTGRLRFQTDNYVILEDGIEVRYQDVVLKARRAEVDLKSREVVAEGDVILDQGPSRITGDTLRYNLTTKLGRLTNATAHVDPDYYFSGRELEKIGDDEYRVVDGVFTSCTDEVPDWSFKVREARIKVEGFARIRGASIRAKKAPLLYLPYLLWPVKQERASGLLVPQPGYSNRRGASLSLAYFQTLGRSADTTLFADLYSKDFFGFGTEVRYRPSEGTEGFVEGYAIDDPERDDVRWKVRLDHTTTDLPFGMRGAISFRDYSDFDYFQDFERDFDRTSRRAIYSRGFVTGNWGPHSLNIEAESRETLVGASIVTQRQLPEAEYRLRSTRLGKTPLYLDVRSSLAYLSLDRSETYVGDYGRFDLAPNLRLPLRAWPWLSVSIEAGNRFTWYGDSLCSTTADGSRPCTAGREFTGESLTRSVPTAGVSVVGPSLSRIFDKKIGSFGKFKHVIEPRWTYDFSGDLDEDVVDETPLYDEVDTLRSRNVGTFSLVNRLLAKPIDEEEGGGAREILSLEVLQSYSFDEDQPLQRSGAMSEPWSPIRSRLRYNPSTGTSLKVEADYNTQFDRLQSTSLSGSYRFSRANQLGLTWFTRWRPETGETVGDQARLWASVDLLPKKLRVEAQINYDFERSLLQQQRYIVRYNSQCYNFVLEGREFKLGQTTERDYRFLLSLKNVGTFLDLSGRQSGAGDF